MRCFLVIIWSIGWTLVSAQVNHIGRYETEYDWTTEDFIPIPNGPKGVLVVRAERSLDGNDFTTKFTHLNSDFEVTWQDSIQVSKTLFLKGYDFNGTQNYLLFQDRTESRILKIVRIDPYNGLVTEFEPRRLTEIDITTFDVIQNSAIVGGFISNRPAAFVYNMDNEKLVTLNNVYQNKSELLEVKINADSLTFNIAASILDEKKDRTVQINTYDFAGNPVRDYELITETDHQLMTASTSSIFNVEQVVVGLYSINSGTSPSGLYVNHVSRTGAQTMKYLPFGAFNTFFDHEGEKRGKRLKSKSLSAQKKNKVHRYRTDALFRKMEERDDMLMLHGEFYKVWGGANNGNAAMSHYEMMAERRFNNAESQESYNEYEFSHAWTLALDRSGNLLWDFNSKIDESIEGTLRPFGAFAYDEGELYYASYDKQELLVDHVNKPLPIDSLFNRELTLLNDDELIFEDDVFKGLIQWYGNKYLVYGIQHVRPKDRSISRRRVFFLNALAVGPDFRAQRLEDD